MEHLTSGAMKCVCVCVCGGGGWLVGVEQTFVISLLHFTII